jgi:hypothetical protein
MPMPDCVAPQSLATWSAVLLYGASALGVEALALLFTLRPVKGGAWRWLALRGLLLAGALAVAAWSLVVRASAQAVYDGYVALFEWNPGVCVWGGGHAGPNYYAGFQQHMQAVAAPIERSATTASGASAVLLIIGVYLLAR